MPLTSADFNKITDWPIGMGAERLEWEQLLAYMINKIIDKGLALDAVIEMEFRHDAMVQRGYLIKHGEKGYALTQKSIGILYGYCGKKP